MYLNKKRKLNKTHTEINLAENSGNFKNRNQVPTKPQFYMSFPITYIFCEIKCFAVLHACRMSTRSFSDYSARDPGCTHLEMETKAIALTPVLVQQKLFERVLMSWSTATGWVHSSSTQIHLQPVKTLPSLERLTELYKILRWLHMQMFGFDGEIFPFVLTSRGCLRADSTHDCSAAARPNTNRWSLINVLLQQGQT